MPNPSEAPLDWLWERSDERLLQAIEHVFQMSVPRHTFEGNFVVPRPFLRIRCAILIGFMHVHVMQSGTSTLSFRVLTLTALLFTRAPRSPAITSSTAYLSGFIW